MKFQTSLFLLAALMFPPSPTLARNKPVTLTYKSKDSVTKKEAAVYDEPKPAESRISRSSIYTATVPQPPSYKLQQYQQAYSYPLVLNPQYTAAASLALASLTQSASGKQPKKPVYHATPLQPYGSLLDAASLQSPKSVVLDGATAGSVGAGGSLASYATEYSAADYSAAYKALKDAAVSAGKPKFTEVTLPETKYSAPAAFKHLATSTSYREDEEKHDEYAAKYQFGYQVRDPKHGSYFGHSESRDGHVTKGHYHVLLPDGRLQNVQYYADLTGFHAQVSYNGVAKHSHAAAHAAPTHEA